MFYISQKVDNGFDIVILKDMSTNTLVEIVPSCGAILHSFSVDHDNETVNVIQSYNNVIEFREQAEELGFLGCKLSPFVCRMKDGTYTFADKKYHIDKFYSGSHALHGLLYNVPFTVSNQFADETMAFVEMSYSYNKMDEGYPFCYDCIVTYKVEKDNNLIINTKVINRSNGLIPIQDGWHPYFTLGDKIDDLQLEFQSKEIIEFDDELLPTGKYSPYQEFGSLKSIKETTLDNCFTLNFRECQPMCVLRNPKKKIEVQIFPDQTYPFLQLYTPSHRNSIAIENLSSAPDAFNNKIGLKILNAGESVTFTTQYKINLLD